MVSICSIQIKHEHKVFAKTLQLSKIKIPPNYMFPEALGRAWLLVSLDKSRVVHPKTYNVLTGFL